MNRRKKLMAMLMAGVMALNLSACGMFEMKMARAAAKMRKLESLHMDMLLELKLSMPGLLGKRLELNVDLSGGADTRFSPLITRAEMNVSALGGDKALLYYLEQSGEEFVMYLSSDGGKRWLKEQLSREQLPAQLSLNPEDLAVFRDCAESFSPAGEEPVAGSKAMRYDGLIRGEQVARALALTGALDALSESLGIKPEPEAMGELGDIPASVWVDNKTGYIVRYRMEPTQVMEGLLSTALEGLLKDYGLEGMAGELRLEQALVTVELSQFNAVGEISVPAAAKAS